MGFNNAAGDAAYLFARACLLDGGTRFPDRRGRVFAATVNIRSYKML